jgi:putative transposase
MHNHVHLLVTPSRVGALASMMQAIGRNYVNYFNTMYRRSGTLWEGRYKSCLIGADYVLICQRYIELNPVRSRLVPEPLSYPWSSYGSNALGVSDPAVVPHAQYLALGHSSEQRAQAYRSLFRQDIDPDVLRDIRAYARQQRALGSPVFQNWVEATFGRHAKVRPAHRPRRQVEVEQEEVVESV